MKKNIHLYELTEYLNSILKPEIYPEHSFLNGLQVEGDQVVNKIACIVSPNKKVFKKAINTGSNLILAHHGLLRLEQTKISGTQKDRLKLLLSNNVSYISYHVPLDANSKYGNNAQICKKLNLLQTSPFGEYHRIKIGLSGLSKHPIKTKKALNNFLQRKLGKKANTVLWPKDRNRSIKSIAVISGGGARGEFLEEVHRKNIDCYITGNIDEGMQSLSKELGIVYISLGHYQSEKWGVITLGEHLESKFGIEVNFIEDNSERW